MWSGEAYDAAQQRRLRWRARRGLLENDILIERFLDREGTRLDAADLQAFAALLALSDPDLLDLLLARKEPTGTLDDDRVRALLARMRAA
jgi:antitoxin CptB